MKWQPSTGYALITLSVKIADFLFLRERRDVMAKQPVKMPKKGMPPKNMPKNMPKKQGGK